MTGRRVDLGGRIRGVPYALFCTILGVALAWIPTFLHGPIPYKYDILGIRGHVAVWAWYTARLLIGFVVGITDWPSWWFLRGLLCGLVMMLPVSIVSLATPGCGPTCMSWNVFTGAMIGLVVAGVAHARSHASPRSVV
jgi:hypothetical protein